MSSKNKKKKRNSLLILFVCMLVCAGGYSLLSVYDTKKEQAEEDTEQAEEIALLSVEEGTVSNVKFHNSFGSMEFLKNGEEWICKEDKKFPLNQKYVNDMEDVITDLTAIRQIAEEAEDMAEYGLESPEIEAVFTAADGKNTLYLGDKSPSSDSGYYCRLNDEKAVYEVESSVFTAFNYSREQMMVLEDSPEIKSGQITKLDIKNPKEFDFIAVNKAMGDYSSWTVRAPYDTSVVGNESNLTTFFENYESLSYGGAKEYNCKNFSKYGLDEKNPETALILIDYYELIDIEKENSDSEEEDSKEVSQEKVDHQAKFVIGSRDEDGNYYVRVNDSSYVYLMDEDDIDNMIPDSSYLYVEPTISKISAENITKAAFTTGDGEYQITKESRIVKNDDEEEETKTDYFFHNKSMEPADFNTIITSWTALKSSKDIEAKEKKKVDKEEVILTAKIEDDSGSQTIEFLRFDKSYYAIKEESILFLADKRDVDGFINKLAEQAAK